MCRYIPGVASGWRSRMLRGFVCLLEGTRRQSLLDVGRIQARPIRVEDIGHFQRVLLVNAMIGLEDEISVPVVNIMK